MKTDQYTAFQASVVLRTQDGEDCTRNLFMDPRMDEGEDRCSKYIILECVPLKSVYGSK